MNLEELEERLRRHADAAIACTKAPFTQEETKRRFEQYEAMKTKQAEENIREEKMMKKTNGTGRKIALIAAALALTVGTTAFAASRYLSAKDAVDEMGYTALAQRFGMEKAETAPVTDGKYTAALLGVVTGEALNRAETDLAEPFDARTYAVVAVERADGEAMTYGEMGCISPLVEGIEPWLFNITRMNGGYTEQIIDGVLYRMIECDDIECLADRNLYIAVTDRTFIDASPYSYDEKTGKISPSDAYDGTNLLFPLKLDESRADPEKAAAYLSRFLPEPAEEEGEKSAPVDAEEEPTDGAAVSDPLVFLIG